MIFPYYLLRLNIKGTRPNDTNAIKEYDIKVQILLKISTTIKLSTSSENKYITSRMDTPATYLNTLFLIGTSQVKSTNLFSNKTPIINPRYNPKIMKYVFVLNLPINKNGVINPRVIK